jgi:uncharacterized protein YukE
MPAVPPAIDRSAAADNAGACDRYAAQLDQLIASLTALRRRVAEEWTGTAGESFCQVLDGHLQSLKRAQADLSNAAASIRSATT